MFHGWDNFFFMIGSGAASLIGLLFVVVTLTQGFERSQAMRGANIYMTPTMVHFVVVLTISATALAPGLSVVAVTCVFALVILLGLGNAVRTCLGIRGGEPGPEQPHWSDFWYYGMAPAAIYVVLGGACVALWLRVGWAPLALGGLLLLLLLVGIRNAWDLVVWIAPRAKGDAS